MLNQINLDATRGTDASGNPTTTISELITSWAPPSQNDTSSYISFVAGQTGYDPNAPLSSLGDGSDYSAAPDPVLAAGTGIDLSSLQTTVDLSAIGISSPVPVYAVIGVSLLGLAFLKN